MRLPRVRAQGALERARTTPIRRDMAFYTPLTVGLVALRFWLHPQTGFWYMATGIVGCLILGLWLSGATAPDHPKDTDG